MRMANLAAMAVVAAVLAGCSKPATTGGGTPSAPKKTIAGIMMQEDQFFRLILFGMKDAAKKAGVELLTGNSNNQPEREISMINTYVARKVDAIVVAPVSRSASVTALQQASDRGVKVVTCNSPIDGDFPVAFIECSATDLGNQTGKAAREYIEKNLGGKAKIAIVAFQTQVPEQSSARTGGFKSALAGMPGVEFVAEQDAWLADMAVKKVADILTAHPDVDIVYAANEGGTIGAVMAVKNAGKAGKIAVFGTDSSEQLLDMLQSDDNILQAITSQKPVDVGRMAIESALQSLAGGKVEKKTVLNGVLLSRANPESVKEFAKQFKEWTRMD